MDATTGPLPKSYQLKKLLRLSVGGAAGRGRELELGMSLLATGMGDERLSLLSCYHECLRAAANHPFPIDGQMPQNAHRIRMVAIRYPPYEIGRSPEWLDVEVY